MLAGKCALVTGATGDIGSAIARELARHECNLVINGFGEDEAVEALCRELEALSGGQVLYDSADLARPEEIERLAGAALERFGAVDILVNNAVVRDFAPVETFPPEAWDRGLAVNLSAAFHATRLLLPAMRERNWGRIVNISSIFGLIGERNRIAYVTTKTALLGMTRALALETSGQDITCNAICPGTVHTTAIDERIESMAREQGVDREEAVRRFLATRQPGGEFVSAGNVAALVSFLCGPAGRDITGAALPVDRGWSVC